MLLHGRQGFEGGAQVVGGIEAELSAGFNEAVDDGAVLSRSGTAEEEEVVTDQIDAVEPDQIKSV